MWVKICGNTNLEDARLALDAGADALGFVFAPSPRQLSAAQVKNIVRELPSDALTIGVFVESSFDAIVEAVETSGLRGVQLHQAYDAALIAQLREQFGQKLFLIQVLHDSAVLSDELKQLGSAPGIVDAVLVDSRTATKAGGTGLRFDWERARSGFAEHATSLRVIAAGGLSPANVAEAIQTLQPWGVDAVSGVEASPGTKDHAKVRAFITSARAAAPITVASD